MSDFSEPLAKAFKAVFGDIIRGKYYFHMKQNIIKRYSKKRYQHLEEFIQYLGSCLSCSEVDFLWNLIKKEILRKR